MLNSSLFGIRKKSRSFAEICNNPTKRMLGGVVVGNALKKLHDFMST
jgi:hypothetical protein